MVIGEAIKRNISARGESERERRKEKGFRLETFVFIHD
jgi:hypothetical protein